MAERVGFEPTVRITAQRLSSRSGVTGCPVQNNAGDVSAPKEFYVRFWHLADLVVLWVPFTMPEQSASSRIENLLDRLPSFLRPTRNVSNERMLLEAPVSPAGVSYRNGLVGVTLPFSPSFDTSTARHHGAGACPSSCCTKGTLTRRLHGAWNTHSC